MERLNVNPTRMMLTTLKKRLVTARRGHKLMKDKRDQLMKGFLELARENKRLREEVETSLARVYESFSVASAVMSQEVMEEALMFPKQGVDLTVSGKNIMSVDVPQPSFVKEIISRFVSFLTSSLVRSAPINRMSKMSVTAFCSALVSLIPFV